MTRSEIRRSASAVPQPILAPDGASRIIASRTLMLEFLHRGPALCALLVRKSEFDNLSRALICGIALPPSREREWILDAGVMHLLVVSGWHLFFLERVFSFLPALARSFLLGGYAFLTGFHFPILRALFRRLARIPLRTRFGLTALQAEAVAVLCFLVCDPFALTSRSFTMCWMGGLAMALPVFWRKHSALERALKAYVLLWPFCFSSPVALFWNIALAPWVGFVLFPSVVFSMAVPAALGVSDFMWRGFLFVLAKGPQGTPFDLPELKLFWLPPLIHILFLVLEVKWRRASAFSSPSV